MKIHPVLAPGLEAYRRGDYVAALIAWEAPWEGLDPSWDAEERELALALIRLAGALHHEREGRPDSSGDLYASARKLLEGLPPAVLGVDVEGLRGSMPPSPSEALASPPELEPVRGAGLAALPRRAVLRFLLLVALLALGFAAFRWSPLAQYLQPERVTALLEDLRRSWWSPLALLGLYAVLCPVGLPASPLILAGGFVFGTVTGGLLNFVGTFLGAATSYYAGRLLGRDLVEHLAGERLRKVERMLNRRSFWALTRIRFVPVPFPIVNYGAALAGVRAPLFLAASALGLAPAVFIYTFFASALARATAEERGAVMVQMGLAVLAVLALSFLPTLIRGWSRRRRYERILEKRRERQSGSD